MAVEDRVRFGDLDVPKRITRSKTRLPYEYGYDFKVIVTNKPTSAKKALTFHNGRGAQEGVFAELKSHTQMDYVPTRKKAGNQTFLLSAGSDTNSVVMRPPAVSGS